MHKVLKAIGRGLKIDTPLSNRAGLWYFPGGKIDIWALNMLPRPWGVDWGFGSFCKGLWGARLLRAFWVHDVRPPSASGHSVLFSFIRNVRFLPSNEKHCHHTHEPLQKLNFRQQRKRAFEWDRCRVVRLGDLKEKKRPHHVEKQLTNNSCWKGNWKTTSFNRDNGKLKISEVEQTALYLQSLQIESCLLLAIRFSDTDSWCPCILVLGYSIFSWLFRNCVYSSKKSITDAL